MPQVEVNWLAILVSTVIYMVLGFVWYHPSVFGKKWMELTRIDEKTINHAMKVEAPKIFGGSFVLAFLMFFVLASAIDYAGAFTIAEGAFTAFWIWLGFVFSVSAVGCLYERKPFGLLLINSGYVLVSLLAGGIILAVWI